MVLLPNKNMVSTNRAQKTAFPKVRNSKKVPHVAWHEKRYHRVGLGLNWQPKEWIGFRWAERRNDIIG